MGRARFRLAACADAFVIAATVVALYLVGLVAFVVAVCVTIVDGSADRLGDWIDDVDVFPVLVIVVASFAVAGLLVAMLGWYGVPRSTLRFCRARNPRGTDAHRAQRAAIAFALSYGLRAPTMWVIDDPAPNALARSGGAPRATSASPAARSSSRTRSSRH